MFSELKFDLNTCINVTYKIEAYPIDFQDRIDLTEAETSILIHVKMSNVTEPFAVQVMAHEPENVERSRFAYTAFMVNPYMRDDFCPKNPSSCLC